MTGIELIANERRRQVEREGWTPEHDDTHEDGEIAIAAACYAAAACYRTLYEREDRSGQVIFTDPWPQDWDDKRSKTPGRVTRIRMLVKAGALVAAEIDRLQREATAEQTDREEP